jgi:DNA replicative helicase MCM subunit Mcm2 (Cdc46/Mcm family)
MVQNVNLPPTLLSRFDLICIMLDQPDEMRDTQLARHMLSLYMADSDYQRRRQNEIVVRLEFKASFIFNSAH